MNACKMGYYRSMTWRPTWRSTDPRRRRKDWPLCGARTRAGREFKVRAEPGKARCRFHGGLAEDPGRPGQNRRRAAHPMGSMASCACSPGGDATMTLRRKARLAWLKWSRRRQVRQSVIAKALVAKPARAAHGTVEAEPVMHRPRQ
jgi:hypothetical protein